MDVDIVSEDLHNLVLWTAFNAFKYGDIFIVPYEPLLGAPEDRPV